MQSWSMMAIRGSLGILLGLTILLGPPGGLGGLVVLFGVYALLDGISAAAWASASRRPLESWPVLLEGVFSIGLGVLALWYPLEAAPFVHVVALWGLVTGILEVAGAVHWSHGVASKWCLVAGGVWSLFLGSLVLVLPYAVTDDLVMAIGVYALVFGILVSVAAFRLQRVAPTLIGTVKQTG